MVATGIEAVAYASASARVAGLKAQLLRSQDWDALLSADSQPRVFDVLRSTPYARVLRAGESSEPNIESLERRLLGLAADNVVHAMSQVRGAARNLLLTWWAHFELENLKAVFRGVEQGLSPAQMREYLIPLGNRSRIDWEALLHERSVAALVERMAGTHYINPLRNALHLYTRYGTLFPLEVAMDVRYYRDIPAAIKHLGAGDRGIATRLLGTRLDILNILWAFRYRIYYQLSAEEIINFTIWHTVHTDVTLIQTIATGAPIRDVVEQIWGRDVIDLDAVAQARDEAAQLPLLELALHRYWHSLAKRAMTGYPFGLGLILGYLIVQEIEVHDLVTAVEAKGLGWGRERITQRLIGSAASGRQVE